MLLAELEFLNAQFSRMFEINVIVTFRHLSCSYRQCMPSAEMLTQGGIWDGDLAGCQLTLDTASSPVRAGLLDTRFPPPHSGWEPCVQTLALTGEDDDTVHIIPLTQPISVLLKLDIAVSSV